MNDHSHLKRDHGKGETRSLIQEGETNPDESKELLSKMKHISGLISEVILFDSLNLNNYREQLHS